MKPRKPKVPLLRKLRTAGLILAAAGGAIITAPVTMPAIVTDIAQYLAVAGGVLTAVSQAAYGRPARKQA
ncbi:hypothetical protein [Chitinophaga sp. XS-30]|uniref:hypothetical protein n=1 Tax=Chitinophaga sp. XS-30 TaxID=2604421 RepID=UPI0011DD60AD|nr:hypothetical protein [Chitinophaga sp. XS-30]QEH43302.1 hypothetical protein FW415_21530 [Chitinophaga sp. XS-30]